MDLSLQPLQQRHGSGPSNPQGIKMLPTLLFARATLLSAESKQATRSEEIFPFNLNNAANCHEILYLKARGEGFPSSL